MSDFFKFIQQWAAAPLQVAAIAPSGRRLAELMTQGLDENSGPIIELGPGTGVFTRAMIEIGIPEEQIAMFELNTEFAEEFQNQFPKAQVYNMSAAELEGKALFDVPVTSVLSGLGFLSMPRRLVDDIVRGAFSQLKQGGDFVQFTYGPKCPVPASIREDQGLDYERVGGTMLNLPPASVYRLTKRDV